MHAVEPLVARLRTTCAITALPLIALLLVPWLASPFLAAKTFALAAFAAVSFAAGRNIDFRKQRLFAITIALYVLAEIVSAATSSRAELARDALVFTFS